MRQTPSSSWPWLERDSCGHPHTWPHNCPPAFHLKLLNPCVLWIFGLVTAMNSALSKVVLELFQFIGHQGPAWVSSAWQHSIPAMWTADRPHSCWHCTGTWSPASSKCSLHMFSKEFTISCTKSCFNSPVKILCWPASTWLPDRRNSFKFLSFSTSASSVTHWLLNNVLSNLNVFV